MQAIKVEIPGVMVILFPEIVYPLLLELQYLYWRVVGLIDTVKETVEPFTLVAVHSPTIEVDGIGVGGVVGG